MKNIILSNGRWSIELSEEGRFIALRDPSITIVPASPDAAICELVYGTPEKKIVVTGGHLRGYTPSYAEFETGIDAGGPVTMRFTYDLPEADDDGSCIRCRVGLHSDDVLTSDVQLTWLWSVRLPGVESRLFAPLFDGRGLRTSRSKHPAWNYVCAGEGGEGTRLAIPVVDTYSVHSRLHIAYFSDPFFSTRIDLPPSNSPERFQCRFLNAAGPHQFVERTFGLYVHEGESDAMLQGFFRYGTPDSAPGPGWLHDIAMVHYDYLGENGEGWFRDIDRLMELVTPGDRSRIALTLHGWYDFLGRYCFDDETHTLNAKWTVMPRGHKREMSLADMHRRLAYGKERGFRVLMYYGDGMAIDAGAPNYDEKMIFRNHDGTLRLHHWAGPDTIAQTYIMNPLHPRVQSFFRGYTAAILQEFGNEIDGLTWDETFTTRAGDISRGEYPGYADRAFMMLGAELRNLVKAKDPNIALLASDCVGLALPQENGTYWSAHPAQNAIVFDGTYQDSQCYPTAWQYGIFPNYRNVLWSCNWRPVQNFEWTVLGVKGFGAPVAISNGWGEDRGISRYSEQQIEKVMDLFRFRIREQFKIRWLECSDL